MHIFISYAKVDTYDLAIQLQAELRQLRDVTVWMDETLIPGESWAAQIQSEIRRCDVVMVLLSPDVNREPDGEKGHSFVINEIEFAQRRKKPIVPVMVQHTDMPIQIATLQYIDITRNYVAGLKRLTEEITRRVAAVPAVEPTPPAPLPFSPVPTQQPSIPPASTSDPLPFSPVPIQQQTAPVKPPTLSPVPPTPARVQPAISPTSMPVYRRPAFIIGFIVLVLIIVGAVILPSLNPPTLPTPKTNVSLLPSDSPPPTLPTVTLTLTLTDTPQPTATSLPNATSTTVPPTATFTPEPPTVTFTPTLPLGFRPITHNSDWTPQYQTFNGYEMALVPVGCFMMGSDTGEDIEKPVNPQCFDQPLWIDRYEVTNKQYGSEGNFKGANRPRESVTWFQARDFCLQRGARLPTEREWEYAARGPDNLVYPWGNDFVADNVVYSVNSNSQTADVGSRPAGNSWVGASDLSGNVWEWVSSSYQSYPYKADDGREVDRNTDGSLVLRGGSWYNDKYNMRAAYRSYYFSSFTNNFGGIRCARSQ